MNSCAAFLLLGALTLTAAEEKAIAQLAEAHAAAWNQRDAAAMVAMYTEDADHLSSRGVMTKGRAALEKRYGEWLKDPVTGKSTHKPKSANVRLLSPDVGLLDVEWERTDPGADGPRSGNYTAVVVKRDGKWLISAFRVMVPVK